MYLLGCLFTKVLIERRLAQVTTNTSGESHRRGIIFCCSINDCKVLGAQLSAPVYYDALTYAQRRCAVNTWRTAADLPQRVMVATTAFNAGIDCAGVRLVVHTGPLLSAVKHAQETGRGGHDDQGAE